MMIVSNKTSFILRTTSWLLGLGFVIAIVFIPLSGHDTSVHRSWISTYRELFGVFSWYPRWSHRSNFGLGSPVFYFYPPLTYMITSVVGYVVSTASIDFLFRCAGVLSTVIAFWAMRWAIKNQESLSHVSLLGAALYAFNPYSFYTFVTRGSLSEVVGFAFIPLILGSIQKIAPNASPKYFLVATISLALLCLSSVPLAVGCCIVVLAAIAYHAKQDWSAAALQGWALLLGLGAAGILIVPAELMLSRLNASHLWPPEDHSPLLEIVNGGFPQTRVVLPLLFFAIVSVWIVVHRKSTSSQRKSFLGVVWGLSLLLQVPYLFYGLSLAFSPLHLLQFSWRLNAILMFCSIVYLISIRKFKLSLLYCGLSLAITYGIIALNVFHLRGEHAEGSTAEAQREFYSASMKSNGVEEAMRRSATLPFLQASAVEKFDTLECSPYQRRFEVTSTNAQTATLNLYYWPEWRVKLNGANVQTFSDEMGRTTFLLPAGKSVLDLHLDKSKYEVWGEIVSVLSLLLSVATTIVLHLRARRRNSDANVMIDNAHSAMMLTDAPVSLV